MSRSKLFTALLVIACIIWVPALPAETRQVDKYLLAVLDKAKAGDSVGALDQILVLDERGSSADMALVRLLDYYVGEGQSEVLSEAITKRGKRMLKLLKSQKKNALRCLPDYMEICISKFADGVTLRNEYIDRLIDAINRGVVLRAD